MSARPEETDYETCGTYAGWNQHQRDRTRKCGPCRRANAEYMREYRKAHPEKYRQDLDQRYARERALSRLAELHPTQFAALLAQERT